MSGGAQLEMFNAMSAVKTELDTFTPNVEVGEIKLTTNGFHGGIDVRVDALTTNDMEDLVLHYNFHHGRLTWLTTTGKQDVN